MDEAGSPFINGDITLYAVADRTLTEKCLGEFFLSKRNLNKFVTVTNKYKFIQYFLILGVLVAEFLTLHDTVLNLILFWIVLIIACTPRLLQAQVDVLYLLMFEFQPYFLAANVVSFRLDG